MGVKTSMIRGIQYVKVTVGGGQCSSIIGVWWCPLKKAAQPKVVGNKKLKKDLRFDLFIHLF